MPETIAERFKQGEETIAVEHQNATVIFADIIGLDRLQVELSSQDSLVLVNELIRQMDAAADDLGLTAIDEPLASPAPVATSWQKPNTAWIDRVFNNPRRTT